ncbi:glycosyltransferase, partial [Arthrospira platensis SPKY1]|nr:glycosyltransferase [Arthrospira platensis SPKY1]
QDDTHELLEQLEEQGFLSCTVLRHKKNMGVAASYAKAWKHCKHPYVLLLHNDCLLEEGALAAMCSVLDAHPDVSIVGPRMNTAHLAKQIGKAREDEGKGWERIDYVDGACMLIRASSGIQPDEQF